MRLTIQKNVFHYYIDLLRGKNCGETNGVLHNIIKAMRMTRHNMVCGENFDDFDFGNTPLNGVYWSLNGSFHSSFHNCRLNEWNFMSGHTSLVNDFVWTPDRKKIITVSEDGSAIMWDACSGLILLKFSGHRSGIKCVSISNDGLLCWTGAWDQTICEWDTTNGALIKTC